MDFNILINFPCCNGLEAIPAGPITPAEITATKSFNIILNLSPLTNGCPAFSAPILTCGAPNVILFGESNIIESDLARKIILFASATSCDVLKLLIGEDFVGVLYNLNQLTVALMLNIMKKNRF